MLSNKIFLIITLLFLSLSFGNCQEEETPYDINQGVLYKEFIDGLFEKYDPENKEFINKQGYKELLVKMFVNEDEDIETKQLLEEVIEEFVSKQKDKISHEDINDHLKEQRLLKFMSSKFQINTDL